MAKLSLAKLERHLYSAADRLRQEGLDAATYKDYIFGLLFLTTLAAARRSVDGGGREALVLVGSAVVLLVLLVPIGGALGDALAAAADWAHEVPNGAVFRGILIGVAVLVAHAPRHRIDR